MMRFIQLDGRKVVEVIKRIEEEEGDETMISEWNWEKISWVGNAIVWIIVGILLGSGWLTTWGR